MYQQLIAVISLGALYKSNTPLSLLQVAEGWLGEFKNPNSKFQISNLPMVGVVTIVVNLRKFI
jgi:hypothetical protein